MIGHFITEALTLRTPSAQTDANRISDAQASLPWRTQRLPQEFSGPRGLTAGLGSLWLSQTEAALTTLHSCVISDGLHKHLHMDHHPPRAQAGEVEAEWPKVTCHGHMVPQRQNQD